MLWKYLLFTLSLLFISDVVWCFDTDTLQDKNAATQDYIGIYQKYIGAIRGFECPMYPSCSNFGMKVFKEKSFAQAFVLTSDRLLRCGHENQQYALTLRSSGFKLLDFPDYSSALHHDLAYESYARPFAFEAKIQSKDSLSDFVNTLINKGYYQEALLEIHRLEFLYKSISQSLFVNKLICMISLERYEEAIFTFEVYCPKEFKNDPAILFQASKAYLRLYNNKKALELATVGLNTSPDAMTHADLLRLQGLAFVKLYQWEKSKSAYQQLTNNERWNDMAQTNLRILDRTSNLRRKSPLVAGALSIIPGAGYAYAGHRQTAISALAVNGLLAFATYSSFKNENYGIGVLTGIFNLSFYIGNIYGSVKSAKRFNQRQKDSIIEKINHNTAL